VKDFQAFCRSTGNELVTTSREGNVFKFVIKRVK
jgi:tRNA 2-thiouridine synthesizing protein A